MPPQFAHFFLSPRTSYEDPPIQYNPTNVIVYSSKLNPRSVSRCIPDEDNAFPLRK